MKSRTFPKCCIKVELNSNRNQEFWKPVLNKNPVMTISEWNAVRTSSSVWKAVFITPLKALIQTSQIPVSWDQRIDNDQLWEFNKFGKDQSNFLLCLAFKNQWNYLLALRFLQLLLVLSKLKMKKRKLNCKTFPIKLHRVKLLPIHKPKTQIWYTFS